MIDESHPGTGANETGGHDKFGTKHLDNFLSLNLGIGDAFLLQDTTASNLRYYVKLIGFLNKAGIVVSYPVKQETLLPVEDGTRFVVRGFSGRKAYEFEAEVLSAVRTPYPHLHISFPKLIEFTAMRSALRIQPKLSGWIELKDATANTVKIPAVVLDISTSGARIQAITKFGKVGDEIKVAFHLPIDNEEQVFLISAVVRNSYNESSQENKGGAEMATHGVEFIQPEGTVRMALQGFIYKSMAEV